MDELNPADYQGLFPGRGLAKAEAVELVHDAMVNCPSPEMITAFVEAICREEPGLHQVLKILAAARADVQMRMKARGNESKEMAYVLSWADWASNLYATGVVPLPDWIQEIDC